MVTVFSDCCFSSPRGDDSSRAFTPIQLSLCPDANRSRQLPGAQQPTPLTESLRLRGSVT